MLFQVFLFFIIVNSVSSQLITSLNAVLDYGISNKINDTNFLLGVAIANGQLDVVHNLVTEDTNFLKVIHTLQGKCSYLLNAAPPNTDPLTLSLSPELWTLSPPLQELPSPPPLNLPSLSQEGPLTHALSDDCLRSLLSHCSLTPVCISAELSNIAGGYEITHQVLYWTLYLQKCKMRVANNSTVQAVIRRKCCVILHQHYAIEAMDFPSYLQDLYFEQLIVCGLHGFSQFLTLDHQHFLLTLQTTQGCFHSLKHRKHFKRNCDSHITGVATAVLSLLIKHRYGLTDN